MAPRVYAVSYTHLDVYKRQLAALVGADALSPDARAAAAAYRGVCADLATTLGDTASGRELRDRGYPDDIAIAAEVDASLLVPVLREGRFVAMVGGVELRLSLIHI